MRGNPNSEEDCGGEYLLYDVALLKLAPTESKFMLGQL